MRRFSFLVLLLAAAFPAAAQQTVGCNSPESKQLDFWVGEWDLTYGDGGKGTNRITKILDGCAILEEFTGAPGVKLNGRSFSTFDVATRRWKQAWVDDSGAYLDFTGSREDGRMVFAREATRGEKEVPATDGLRGRHAAEPAVDMAALRRRQGMEDALGDPLQAREVTRAV